MTGSLLERLGATPEQIDRERDRIRSELFHRAAVHEVSRGGWPWPAGDAGSSLPDAGADWISKVN